MATTNLKHEHSSSCSPGTTRMLGGPVDRPANCSREKSFTAMQGLIMAEDRRTKEKDIGNFQNLMEYREAPASPSASSVTTTVSLENCGSPDISTSPPQQEPQEMDDERLPNELLDELCEDIGMKEGMELDFVEFLMEQDMVDPQQYMTPEALRSSGFPMPVNQSQTNSALSMTMNKNFEHTGSLSSSRNCGSPSFSIASSTNVTVATSSGSSSPISKRFHLSNSGPPSPPPLILMGNQIFKAPQTPPTSRRLLPVSQGAISPRSNLSISSNHSDRSIHSNHSSSYNSQNLPPQRSCSPQSIGGGAPLPQMPHSTTGTSGYHKSTLQYGQYPGMGQNIQNTPMAQSYQRHGRAVHPNANVPNIQVPLSKFVSQAVAHSQGNIRDQQSFAMNNSGNLGNINFQGQCQTANSHFNNPIESPLDQGYFTSSDSISGRSLESGAFTAHSSCLSNSVNALSSQRKLSGANLQKSVQFAAGTSVSCVCQNGSLPYEPCYRTNVPDCELEEYRNSIQKMHSKMMPRLNHHVKPETAPYTVPFNNGQTTMNPFEYSNLNNMQPLDYHQKSSSNGFATDNNQNLVMQNYSENIPVQPNMSNMNCQMSQSCTEPMGPMHQSQMDPYRRGPSACQLQDAKSPAMFDTTNMQTNMMKNNCQFVGQSQGNMNKNCSKMGINEGVVASGGHMSSAQQADMGINCNNGQNFHNSQSGYPSQRPVHMNMSSASGSNGMMGYDHQFEQSHGMSANMNMDNIENGMYLQNQGASMNWTGAMPPTRQPHQMGAAPHSNPIGMSGNGLGIHQGHCGQLSGGTCSIPNCENCKSMASPDRPSMMSSQQSFIQHLISDRSNAFRSHPLFPLLRDLIIADMNFNTPNFPYQLISNLPVDFDKLLQNFLHRNPPVGNYQTNYAVESVAMDALKYAHHCLIEKIHQKQEQDVDKQSKSTSKSLSAIEEFCNKFDQSARKSYIKPATLQAGGGMGPGNLGNMPNGVGMGPIGHPEMNTPQKDVNFAMNMSNMMHGAGVFMSAQTKKELEFGGMLSPGFKGMMDYDVTSDCGNIVSSSSHPNKPESKKHPSLPKEAVAVMLDWLRLHKDNPYPNDDEKSMLIKQTGLSINQINYWFTNARRRILPKWAQQCKT